MYVFRGEISKLLAGYPLLFGTMNDQNYPTLISLSAFDKLALFVSVLAGDVSSAGCLPRAPLRVSLAPVLFMFQRWHLLINNYNITEKSARSST